MNCRVQENKEKIKIINFFFVPVPLVSIPPFSNGSTYLYSLPVIDYTNFSYYIGIQIPKKVVTISNIQGI